MCRVCHFLSRLLVYTDNLREIMDFLSSWPWRVVWPRVFGQNITVAGTCDCHFLMDRRLRGLGSE